MAKQHHHDDHHWNHFMDQVGLDVFQFILSYLPPIPYLFQLQRVSQHWKQLCCECMKEDCTELYWDLSTISGLKCKGFLGVIEDKLPPAYKHLKVGESYDVRGLGFLRIILSHFKKVKRITLKNMSISVGVFYAIFVEWEGILKELCLIDCNFDTISLASWIRFKFENSESWQNSLALTMGRRLEDIEISAKFTPYCIIPEYGQQILSGFKMSAVEKIVLRNCSSKADPYYDIRCLLGEFMGLFKCFSPHLKYVDVSNLSPSTNVDKLLEELNFHLLFPNVVFQKNIYNIASQMLNDGISYQEVINYYFEYFVNEFKFRRNRLDAYAARYLSSFDDFSNFHKNIAKPLLIFFLIHSPFGIDTAQQDIQGYNIIQLALIHANLDVLKFILDYLTCLENSETPATLSQYELNKLFSHNNKLDGKNAIFTCLTQRTHEKKLLMLLHKYKISFNHQSEDGNTIAHYLCHFGQLQRMKFILEDVLKINMDKTEETQASEVKYFMDFDITNNDGETPLDLCKKYKMSTMFSYLKEQAKQLGITHLPQYKLSTVNAITQQNVTLENGVKGTLIHERPFRCRLL